MKYQYPTCRKSELVEERFGTQLAAPYTWLRDTYSEEVLDFTRRENEFTDEWFKSEAPGEIDAMIERLKAEHVEELPMAINPWKDGYLALEVREGDYSIVFLDEEFKKKETLFRKYDLPERDVFGAYACPADDNLLAIMTQVENAPRPDYLIYDWEKKEVRAILPMTFSGTWSKIKKAGYAACTKVEEDKSLSTIKMYDGETDEVKEIFVFDGNAIFGAVESSHEGGTIAMSFSADYSNDYFYMYDEESGEISPINADKPLPIHYVDTIDGKHYFISFMETPHGQVLEIEKGKTLDDAKVVYEEKKAYIEFGYQAGGHLCLQCAENGANYVLNMETGARVPMPEEIASISPAGRTKKAWIFSFDAFLSQPQLLSFDGKEFKHVAGDLVKHDDLMVEFCFAESAEDKKPIPYYLVRRKDAEKNGANKALIYGYGGYNVSMPPWSTERVTQVNIAKWVEEGGIYVHCLLRGGNEYGSTWHEEGMGMKKKNCYYDFIGIAEKVIADGWTSPKKIAISGASNGGLLMAALVTMRPDLWGCVIASVPHTDMIHFVEDDRGAMYVTEYGDPRESKEMFEYFLSYSPVHNVRETDYPPTYIQTGECDNNVPPYHGKSFAATMQELNTGDNPILLRVLEKGSHDRGQGEVYWQTHAEMRVFMEKALE